MSDLHQGAFGSCCKELSNAMIRPPISFFFKEGNGALLLTVGYAQEDGGPSWFDQAVIFCPFCGKQLQPKEEIAKKPQQ